MRSKKFLNNSVFAILMQIVVMTSGLIIPRFILFYYGSEINGLISSITQLIMYVSIIEAGLSSATIFALYKPLANRNYNKINAIMVASKKFYSKVGFIFIAVITIVSFAYPLILKLNIVSSFEVILLILIMSTSGLLDFFIISKYRALLMADQKNYIVSISVIIYSVLYTALIVILTISGVNIVLLRAFAIFAVLARSLVILYYVKKKYKYLDFDVQPDFGALHKRHDALYLKILGVVQMGSPIIILTFVSTDLIIVSVYSVYFLVVNAINGILGNFVNSISPSFGQIISINDNATLKRGYFEFSFLFYPLLFIVYLITYLLLEPFISIYTTGVVDANYIVPSLGLLFVINGLIYNLKTPQGMLVIAAGHFKETRTQTTIQALILIFFGVFLTYMLGIYGVVIASILSNLYRLVDLFVYVPKKIIKSNSKYELKLLSINIITSLLLAYLLIHVNIFDVLTINNVKQLLAALIILGVTVSSCIIIVNIAFDFSKFKSLYNKIKNLLKRSNKIYDGNKENSSKKY